LAQLSAQLVGAGSAQERRVGVWWGSAAVTVCEPLVPLVSLLSPAEPHGPGDADDSECPAA